MSYRRGNHEVVIPFQVSHAHGANSNTNSKAKNAQANTQKGEGLRGEVCHIRVVIPTSHGIVQLRKRLQEPLICEYK